MGEGAIVPVRRGRAYQELLASNSECRRPPRLPREGRREGQAGGERHPDGAEARRRYPAGRPPPAVHRRRASAVGAERILVLPHFRCSSRPGDQGKALRCLALLTSRTAPVSNRQQARNRPRTSFALNGITVLVLLYLHRKCGRTRILPKCAG